MGGPSHLPLCPGVSGSTHSRETEVDSELRCGQSETRIPPGHSDWLGVAHLSPNGSPGKASLRGAKCGRERGNRVQAHWGANARARSLLSAPAAAWHL